jgi:predicted dienelactone hydrolase
MMTLVPLVSLVGLLSVAQSPAAAPAPDPGAAGPYAVGHTSFTIVDSSRDVTSPFGGRPVFVSVWYPADGEAITAESTEAVYPLDPFYRRWPVSYSRHWEQFGMERAYEGVPPSAGHPFPLVLVSGGWGSRYFGMFYYGLRLASHGFVVAVVQHYHDGYGNDGDVADSIDVAMVNRPLDVSFVLDELQARNSSLGDLLFDAVRPDLVAAMGHSLGGYAAMVLAGGDDVVCGSPEDPLTDTCVPVNTTGPDPRIKAIVPLDGSSQLLHFDELQRITVPSMAIGEAWGSQMQDWQARQHAAISGPPSYRADIRNTVHASFAANCTAPRVLFLLGAIGEAQLKKNLSAPQCTTALPQMEVLRLAAKYAVAFLKTHLAGETGYQRVLTPGWALTQEADVEFFVTEKRDGDSVDVEWPDSFWYFPHQPGSAQSHALWDPVAGPRIDPIEP